MYEGCGTQILDLSGYGEPATLTNVDPGYGWLPGPWGPVVDLDGTDDHLVVPAASQLEVKRITMSVRFRPITPATSGRKPLMLKSYTSHADPYYQYGLFIYDVSGNHRAYMDLAVGGTRHVLMVNDAGWSYSIWHILTGTYDGETMRLYLDGVEIGLNTSPSGDLSSYPTEPLLFSAHDNLAKTSAYCFGGQLDHAYVWSRALSASEITQLFAHPFAMFRPRRRKVCGGPAVIGPYRLASGQTWRTGATTGQTFNTGPTAGQIDG